jgi:hypothetical protein
VHNAAKVDEARAEWHSIIRVSPLYTTTHI